MRLGTKIGIAAVLTMVVALGLLAWSDRRQKCSSATTVARAQYLLLAADESAAEMEAARTGVKEDRREKTKSVRSRFLQECEVWMSSTQCQREATILEDDPLSGHKRLGGRSWCD